MPGITGLAPHHFKHVLWLDYETFSEANLKQVGLHPYAEDPTTRIIMLQWAVDDAPANAMGEDHPNFEATKSALLRLIQNPHVLVVAHNLAFEHAITTHCLGYAIPWDRCRCTMVQAMSHALPGGLDQLCSALPIPEHFAKMDKKVAGQLINRFCKPAPKNHKATVYNYLSHPTEWTTFIEYGRLDVEAMRACVREMPNVNVRSEAQGQWERAQRINNYGIRIDHTLVDAGTIFAARHKENLQSEFHELQDVAPGEAPLNTGQRAAVLSYYQNKGCELINTKKVSLLQYIGENPDMDSRVQRMMEVALSANQTSTSKFAALARMVCSDWRLRGGFQFAGAGRTRREAGRGPQLQNLKSRGIPDHVIIMIFVEALRAHEDTRDMGDQIALASAAIRPCLIASKGYKMAVADLSNIESRVLAWLAGSYAKLQAFRDVDNNVPGSWDVYVLTVAGIMGIKPSQVTKSMRNSVGKVAELACGFSGGVGAMQQFAIQFGIQLQDLHEALDNLPEGIHTQARVNWEKWGKDMDRPEARLTMIQQEWELEWHASEVIKLAWRSANPDICSLWYAAGRALKSSLKAPGQVFMAGKYLAFRYLKIAGSNWLTVRLPSGMYLTYYEPHIHRDGEITCWSINDNGGWSRQKLYAGIIIANATQSTARDVMMPNMKLMEDKGWNILGTVHDEIMAEREEGPDFEAQFQQFTQDICTVPDWARDMPLSAGGDMTYQYGKFEGAFLAVGRTAQVR